MRNASVIIIIIVAGSFILSCSRKPNPFESSISEYERLVFWNKLDSENSIFNSEIVPDGSIYGSSLLLQYGSAQYGNGVKTADRVYPHFPSNILDREKGCIEMWIKPEFDASFIM